MATQVIKILEDDIKLIEVDERDLITRLREGLARRSDADNLLDEQISEVKSHFGAQAANGVDDDQAAAAIAEVEQWVTDNISNGSVDRRIAAALTLRFPHDLVKEWGC